MFSFSFKVLTTRRLAIMSKKPNNDFSIWEWILIIDIILIVIATIGTLIEPIVGVLCPFLVVILIVVSIACAIRTKKKNNNEIKLENEKNQEADCIEKKQKQITYRCNCCNSSFGIRCDECDYRSCSRFVEPKP